MTQNATRTARWRVVSPDRLTPRHWGEETILFNQASGQTHYLNQLAWEVLSRLMRGGPLTWEALIASLADCCEPELLDRSAPAISALLEELDSLGLIEPAP